MDYNKITKTKEEMFQESCEAVNYLLKGFDEGYFGKPKITDKSEKMKNELDKVRERYKKDLDSWNDNDPVAAKERKQRITKNYRGIIKTIKMKYGMTV